MKTLNLNLFKLINLVLKYYVVCSSIIMTGHCLLLLLGTNMWIIDLFIGLSLGGFISLYITSFILGYCWLYRNFLFHQFLVSSCIVWQMHVGFGPLLLPMRWIMFMYGIILICILIKNKFLFDTSFRLFKFK